MTREEKEKAIPAKLATFLREHGRFDEYVELLDAAGFHNLLFAEKAHTWLSAGFCWTSELYDTWVEINDKWQLFLAQATEQSTINTATYRPHETPRRVESRDELARTVYAASQRLDAMGGVVSVKTQPSKSPVHAGVLATFPDALEAVAAVAQFGANKYCSGKIGWNREVSKNHLESATRHLMRAGEFDDESGLLHSAHLAWRVLAALQIELENAEAT